MDFIESLRLVLRYIHLLGFASLTIGTLIQLTQSEKKINKLMSTGAVLQVITGFALVSIVSELGEEINMSKISIKLGLLVLLTIILIALRKKKLNNISYYSILAIVIALSAVAVFV